MRRAGAVAVGQGKSNAEIAGDLCVGLATVKAHVSHIFAKMGGEPRPDRDLRARGRPRMTPGALTSGRPGDRCSVPCTRPTRRGLQPPVCSRPFCPGHECGVCVRRSCPRGNGSGAGMSGPTESRHGDRLQGSRPPSRVAELPVAPGSEVG
ncbi:response regulator transcription factor [Geodermatophilus obscurus]|uniref:response regulator transcription factor n=1 Tax=Geodermatophilus obscurus TaxID=1861 RepID=UPI003C7BE24D